MEDLDLLQMALGLGAKWHVVKLEFKSTEKQLDIYLDFSLGETFPCPEYTQKGKVYDTVEKTWRHLNFFQHEAYLHARVPRLRCPKHGVKLIPVPRARQQNSRNVIFVIGGRNSTTVQAFKDHLVKHGGCPEQIREFSCDMFPLVHFGHTGTLP